MKFADFLIKRPVLCCVMSIIMMALGTVSYFQLSVRHYPKISYPIITIETKCSGYSADIVESQVTRVLEGYFSAVNGLKNMSSLSSYDKSTIKLHFNEGVDVNQAFSDVLALIDRAKDGKLPHDMRPIVFKADIDADDVISLCIYSDSMSLSQLNDYVKQNLENYFASVSGVAVVNTYGGAPPEMHVLLDPLKLQARYLDINEISEAIYGTNINTVAVGRFKTTETEFLAKFAYDLRLEKDFENTIVTKLNDGSVIRIKDVAKIKMASEDPVVDIVYDGKKGIYLGIIGQSNSNPIEISKNIRKKIDDIQDKLPIGTKISIVKDESSFIKDSIDEVYKSIIEAVILVILTILLFLRSVRATLIPIAVIPICLVSTFAIMSYFGFTINILTLLALVLATGLIVDDAIVVLENIYRHIEKGESPYKASVKGFGEILFSVIAMTLTLCAVYLPVVMASGSTGKIFREFAITLAGCVLISGFVALTLSPMMCAYILRGHSAIERGSVFWKIERLEIIVRNFYDRILSLIFVKQRVVLAVTSVFIGLSLISLYRLPNEWVKKNDKGIIGVVCASSVSNSLSYIGKHIDVATDVIKQIPEVESVFSIRQLLEYSRIIVKLKPKKRFWGLSSGRTRSAAEIVNEITEKLNKLPMALTYSVYVPSDAISSGGSKSHNLSFYVRGNSGNYDEVIKASRIAMAEVNSNSNVLHSDWDLPAMAEEYEIRVKRDIASEYGITNIRRLADNVSKMIRGRQITTFKDIKTSNHHYIRVMLDSKHKKDVTQLYDLYVKPDNNKPDNKMISLRDIIEIKNISFCPHIAHTNGDKSIVIDGTLKKGVSPMVVYNQIKESLRDKLPEGFYVSPAGPLLQIIEESSVTMVIFVLALIFIFLIMAAQFESFISPLIVMLSVPLALCGALLTLSIIPDGSLNVFSKIGMVTLIGLITKHGILIVDFADRMVESGKPILESIIDSCKVRFRPILMTTFAMVLGAVPLAMATGAGAESRRQLGWVIVGGMTTGTLFTLIVLPLVYYYIKPFGISKRKYDRN